MRKYRKKPAVVEAIQFTQENAEEIASLDGVDVFLAGKYSRESEKGNIAWGQVEAIGGVVSFRPGDWIIRGVNGELYPCTDNIFQKTYEAYSEENEKEAAFG